MTVLRSPLTLAEAKVYVVADPYEAELVSRWLAEDGFVQVRQGDGGDDTLTDLQHDPAHLMILAATLVVGDSLSFAGAVRESAESPMIVLIGDDKGPVRTALDGMDYAADRFLRRPLARGALLWAVKSCLQIAQTPGSVVARVAVRPATAPVAPFAPVVESGPIAPDESVTCVPGSDEVVSALDSSRSISRATRGPDAPPVPPRESTAHIVALAPPLPARLTTLTGIGGPVVAPAEVAPIAPPAMWTDPAVSGAAVKLSEAMETAIDAYLHDAMEGVLSGDMGDDEAEPVEALPIDEEMIAESAALYGDAPAAARDTQAVDADAAALDADAEAVDADAAGAVVDDDPETFTDEAQHIGVTRPADVSDPHSASPADAAGFPIADAAPADAAGFPIADAAPVDAASADAALELVAEMASDEELAAAAHDAPAELSYDQLAPDRSAEGGSSGPPVVPGADDDASSPSSTLDDAPGDDVAPSIPSWREPILDPAPPWREPTHIISGVAAMGGSAPAPHPSYLAADSYNPAGAGHDDVLGEALSPPPVAPEEARTGTFVSELKRTMSAIEQRLFGDAASLGHESSAAAGGAYEEAAPDIDLDAIAVGSTIPGVAFEGARTRATLAFEDESSDVEESEHGERKTTAPRVIATGGVRGDLSGDDVASLVARLHREGFSGRVTFRRGEAEKTIIFDGGRLVFATSNLPHDRMGDLLYREGKITREQHARSREIVAETGRRMGEILVEMGFLKRRELLPAVRRHVEDVVYSLFAWDTGSFTIRAGDGAQDEKIRLATHPAALVLEGIRRKMGLERLRERIGAATAVIAPLKRDDIAGALAEADLAAEERQAADLFDGRRTITDVVAASKLDELTIYQLAHGLVSLGHARLIESTRVETDSGRVPAGSLAGAADIAIDRERVLAKHAHVLEADYFAVLGVRRDATTFEIRRAYESARRDYAPDTFPAEVQREHAAELREIAAVLDEAFRVLKDDRVRAQYLQNLRE